MIVIKIRFPAGRWHATAWGTHVNEGIPEWPPSPWRLYRALWATWFAKHRQTISEDGMREMLEAFIEGPLPRYALPPAVAAHTRHFMPSIEGKSESRTKIFDTFVQVAKADGDNRLLIAWNVNFNASQRENLAKLLVSMSYLGRAESLVEANLLPEEAPLPVTNARPVHTEETESENEETIHLLAPLPQSEFSVWREEVAASSGTEKKRSRKINLPERVTDCLLLDTADWKSARWSQPPGSRWITYRRPARSFKVAPSRVRRGGSDQLPTVAQFLVTGDVYPDITQALSLGERLHRVLVKYSDSSPVFSGCDEQGNPLSGHRHAYYLAQPDGHRGEVRTITVRASAGFGPRERAALESIRKVWDYDQRKLGLTLVSMGPPPDPAANREESADSLFGTSRVWTSITPFIPTRHAKTTNNGTPKCDEHGLQIGSPAHDLLRLLALERPELPRPEIKAIPGPELPRRLVWLDYQRQRRHGQGSRSDIRGQGFRLTFPENVSGPFVFGYACHFGLGLFVP